MKRLKSIIFFLIFILALTGCSKRRLEYLNERKYELSDIKLKDLKKTQEKHREEFFPDDIGKFKDYHDYFNWYDSLDTAPHLILPDPELPKSLTSKQMIEDFEYLYKTICENYPFLDLIKRRYGIDFVKNYDKYLNEVKQCKNDEEFLFAITNIVDDLKNKHTIVADEMYVENTLKHYSNYWDTRSMFLEFLSLNTQTVRNRYNLKGIQVSKENMKKSSRLNSILPFSSSKNLEITQIDDQTISIKVNEMLPEYLWKEDIKVLEKFLKKAKDYPKLVIDIRQNGGGSIEYWSKFLLPRLLDKSMKISNYLFFKGGSRSMILLEDGEYDYEKLQNIDLASMKLKHKENLKDFSYYAVEDIEVIPKDSIHYTGDIFLLVDEGVYSAAESLASFAKNTKFATLVGVETGGDGITLGVINDYLPNSGYVFTYTNSLGYSPDGNINEEEHTKPDIYAPNYKTMIEIIKKE